MYNTYIYYQRTSYSHSYITDQTLIMIANVGKKIAFQWSRIFAELTRRGSMARKEGAS
jgi:hypothetical protein